MKGASHCGTSTKAMLITDQPSCSGAGAAGQRAGTKGVLDMVLPCQARGDGAFETGK